MRCFLKITIYPRKFLPGSWKPFPALPLTHAVASLEPHWKIPGAEAKFPFPFPNPWGGCKAEDKRMVFFCQGHNKFKRFLSNRNYIWGTLFHLRQPSRCLSEIRVENQVFLSCLKVCFQSKQILSCNYIPGNFWRSVAVWHYGFRTKPAVVNILMK